MVSVQYFYKLTALRTINNVNALAIFFILLFISACGGGSSSNNDAPNNDLDSSAPSAPQQLTIQNQTASSVVLSWAESTDNVSVVAYKIFRDGINISQVTSLQFEDTELLPETNYSYSVSAIDSSNNESEQSTRVSVTTLSAPVVLTAPKQAIANAFSGTSIGLSWLNEGAEISIYRNNIKLADVTDSFYVDSGLSVNTEYSYLLTTGDVTDEEQTVAITVKTLINNTNTGLNNGAETEIVNDRIMNFAECNNQRNALTINEGSLDNCLQAMLAHNSMASHLEDMRAFAARVRSEQTSAMIELGKRLFHSKSLSANQDTSCSSCHHPALGCGGDNLSMPIGVNTLDHDVLGLGRVDENNTIPIVPRSSPATCNTALWTRGLFWDNRTEIRRNRLTTESTDVTNNTVAQVGDNSTLTLLAAQAHFPVTAAPEMGDVTQFGYDENNLSDHTAYRENNLADNLDKQAWEPLFQAAFGDNLINYSRIANAIASYETVQLFIDNPFFNYVDGDNAAITSDQKRGAITFMSSNSGCTFCHAGAFFTTQAQLPGNYPQIGIGKEENNADWGTEGPNGPGVFRAPTLLNVAITGPWGHNGQFATLKRNVEHYRDHGASIEDYFANNEMCQLPQFASLVNCADIVAPNGLAVSTALLEGNAEFSNNLSDAEIDLIVTFLETLTDPDAANPNSNAIRALIPIRDSGPDGNQLDAKDINGNEL